jgi:hypothetical protein
MVQLHPTIPVETDTGERGQAWFVTDYSAEHDVLWGVCFDATRQIWWVPNSRIRGQVNVSMNRPANARA